MKRPIDTPDQIEAMVRTFDPGCVRKGHELLMLNPHRKDRKRKSFSINLDTGIWADFADPTGKAKGGSTAELLRFVKGTTSSEATKVHSAKSKCAALPQAAPSRPVVVTLPAAPKGTPEPSQAIPGYMTGQCWVYLNEEGLPVFCQARYEPRDGGKKEFRPFHWDAGAKRWVMGDPPKGRPPLYHLDQLVARPFAPVLVVEGEGAADAAQGHFPEHVSTTSPHGAASAAKADWSPMAGRSVTIWPDNDVSGTEYAEDVAQLAYAAGAISVRTVEVPSFFMSKWDLADPKPKGANLKQLLKAAVLVDRPQKLVDFVMSLSEFMAQPIKPRDYLVYPWLSASSLNMVFAARGLGKSWFVHKLALCLVTGVKFFSWIVPRKFRVLLVDGEMPKATLHKRFTFQVGKAVPPGLDILTSEDLWLMGDPLNFNGAETQAKFQNMLDALALRGQKPDLIIIDNLSSTTSGIDENDNGAQDGLLRWEMSLRHRGYAVLLVHHSGKNGEQRGASRREDLLDTVIRLSAPANLPEPAIGACFEIAFTKTREERPTPDKLTVVMGKGSNNQAEWKIVQAVSDDVRILQLIHDHAPKSNRELAALLGMAPTTAGKKLGPLIAGGLVANTKPISLLPKGLSALNEASTASAKDGKKRFT